MPIVRKFLDWDRPALPAVADWLIGLTSRGKAPVDLAGVMVVVPGRRAGRRLRELLIDRTGGRLIPPATVTAGELPERLYQPQLPFASDLVQALGWVHALRQLEPQVLQCVVTTPPDRRDLGGWLALGEMLQAQHRELAADGLDFGDVVRLGRELPTFAEHARWEVLRDVQALYLKTLDGLALWDQQTARLVAVKQRECRTDRDIVLVGMTDMGATVRAMLDHVADRVTALIHAPARLADRFDAHGCVIPSAWQDVPIDIGAGQVCVVDRPRDQAEQVVRALASFEGRYRADELAIGMPDERLAPYVQRLLKECGVHSRSAIGGTLSQTAPYRFLHAVAEYLGESRTERFASLVRHPDVAAWLTRRGATEGWLTELDRYVQDYLPMRLGGGAWRGSRKKTWRLRSVQRRVEQLVKPLRSAPQPLGEWSAPLATLLLKVYGDVEVERDQSRDRVLLEACESLQRVLERNAAVPASLAPTVSAAEALRLALRQVEHEQLAPPVDEGAIELLGWLELPLDDSPGLIVTGFNEGVVPTSVSADPFLPDSLRARLGVLDNLRRYARDAYALSALLHSREAVVLIAGRRDERGDPLLPSRLYFAADAETVARRVQECYRPAAAGKCVPRAGALTGAWRVGDGAESRFRVPRPSRNRRPADVVRVTAFRDYLASPYRFYLRHVLKLSELDDRVDELSPQAFGTLLHNVLNEFARSDVRDSAEAAEIREFLRNDLQRSADEQFGAPRIMAVDVQIAQVEMRLAAFAEWQAERRRQGWRIVHSEQSTDRSGVPFDLGDGRSVRLHGRIDRIDRHDAEPRWAIFDYKTGEAGRGPDAQHRREGRWVDLQLPLYRHIARAWGVEGDVELGYIILPSDTNQMQAAMASWTDDELRSADETAREVGRRILDGDFWQELDEPPGTLQEFGAVCQDGVLGREVVV